MWSYFVTVVCGILNVSLKVWLHKTIINSYTLSTGNDISNITILEILGIYVFSIISLNQSKYAPHATTA